MSERKRVGRVGRVGRVRAFMWALIVLMVLGFGFGSEAYAANQTTEGSSSATWDVAAFSAYAPSAGGTNCDSECTKGAAGTKVGSLRSLAADISRYPLGSIVALKFDDKTMNKKYGGVFLVEDTGGAIKGNRIDVLIEPESAALTFGRRTGHIAVLDKGEGSRDAQAKLSNWDTLKKKYSSYQIADTPSTDSDKEKDKEKEGTGTGEEAGEYVSPFKKSELKISVVGVDDRRTGLSEVQDYAVYSFGKKLGGFLFGIAQVFGIFMILIMSAYWMLALMAYSGMFWANELLLKMTFNKVDAYAPGALGTLGKYTLFAFVILSIIIGGMLPKVTALVYQMIYDFVEYLSVFG